jgi:hypothetical protein
MKKLLSSSVIIAVILLFGTAIANEKPYGLKTGNVTGQIAVKGKGPLTGGAVFFFNKKSGPPPSATKYWRVPSHSFPIDKDGRFSAILPEGKYFMGASQKFSGERLGPPQDGDLFFISQDNEGIPKLHTIMQFKPLELGVISEAVPFSRKTLITEGITSIEGTIVDGKGNPVKGMLVFAFPTSVMFGRPLFVSERSDKDGKYLLRLHSGGKYFLSSRSNYGGGPPTADQNMGSYAKGHPLVLKTSETKRGIDITVTRVGVPE